MKFQPRDYEVNAVTNILKAFQTKRRVIAVGPTGCGKTVVASMLVKKRPTWNVLFVVHRYELADQAFKALASNGIRVGVIMAQDEALHGSLRVDKDAAVQVASVQTLLRRDLPFSPDLIIVDECHRILADSYLAIMRKAPKAKVLGLTATAERSDGQALSSFFERLITIASASKLQKQKFLARPRWFGARAEVVAELSERLRGANVSNGDYSPSDLARAVDSKFLVGRVVAETLRLAPNVSKVVFAGSVNHSKRLAASFKRKGLSAAHIDAETPVDVREGIIEGLRTGRIEVVCNYDILGEGFDLPSLGAVILARPFRSLTKYLQVVGRGMRYRKGPRPLIIDHGNNAPRFGLWPGDDIEWTLDGGSGRGKGGGALWKQCEECLEQIPLGCQTCPVCGHECPIAREQREREEKEAQLEELTRAEYQALRARVEMMAMKKNAPAGWVDKVLAEAAT